MKFSNMLKLIEAQTDFVYPNHPETKKGEIFLTNTDEVNNIGWKTARAGKVAYRADGTVDVDCVPVFVQTWELEKAPAPH